MQKSALKVLMHPDEHNEDNGSPTM